VPGDLDPVRRQDDAVLGFQSRQGFGYRMQYWPFVMDLEPHWAADSHCPVEVFQLHGTLIPVSEKAPT
jgi:hypothetical protein